MNKQQLAARIWQSANQMRSKIDANEYKDYILGFIFYKYLSDREIIFAKKEDFTDKDINALSEDDPETVDHFKKNIGYFISYKDLFSTWIGMGNDFDVSNVRDALSAFSRLISPGHKKLFDGIFDTLQTGLSKLGDTAGSQTKAIKDLIHLIKDIPMNGRQDYDMLGFIYEYLIGMFAANAGKKAGEFYTPHEVSLLMSEIIADHLKDKREIQIYDPTSGSGSLLINIGKSVAKHLDETDKIKYYAQELKQNTYNLTRMNLVMRGIKPHNIEVRNADTLEEDWPYFEESDPIGTYNPLYVDAVVSNPPYSQKWDSSNKESDERYSEYGLAPRGKADYAFLLHDLYHVKKDGIMTIVLPHGVLFRGGEEGLIRRNLIEKNNIDAIIGLPANIFFGTSIPTIIMVLRQKRERDTVLIVDASKGFVKEGKNNKLRARDIRRIADTVIRRESIPNYSKVVEKAEIRENDYNLNIPRYVDSSEKTESWDIYSTMFGGIPVKEINELDKYWEALPGLKEAIFSKTSTDYAELRAEDVKQVITRHESVKEFVEAFNDAFAGFEEFTRDELLTNTTTVKVTRQEPVLSEDIFNRLKSIPLIDKYDAYQLLNDQWEIISVDLEVIQTEGFSATKKVEPRMVFKKVKGKEQEVQEGWMGRVIPFDLVQETLLAADLQELKDKENRLTEIASEIDELFDSLSEEDKEADTVNEAKDNFVSSAVSKEAKQLTVEVKKNGNFDEDSYEAVIIKVDNLLAEQKRLNREVKTKSAEFHNKTKETIEGLTDEQVDELLELKWITPLIDSLNNLPKSSLQQLVDKVQLLAEKYSTTFADITGEIQEVSESLAAQIDELTGSEFDMKGLDEFRALLNGGYHEKK
jgi:type I restriction enzyme M protein